MVLLRSLPGGQRTSPKQALAEEKQLARISWPLLDAGRVYDFPYNLPYRHALIL